ncbi:MAG: ABC transporter permease [Saprospiraceae bacterium]|nr:ABC transporter permease [Saprospiraceae bacterium]
MWRLLLRRVLWVIPTLLLLLVLTFGLTRMAPGDPVLFELAKNEELQNQEITLDMYERTARSLGLDKAYFYFSVWPLTYPSECIQLPAADRTMLTKIAQYSASRAEAWTEWQRMRELSDAERKDAMENMAKSRRTWQSLIPSIRWWGSNSQFHDWIRRALKSDFGQSRSDGRPATKRVWEAMRWTLVVNGISIFLAYLFAIPLGVYRAKAPNSAFDRIAGFILNVLYALPVFWMGTLLVVFFSTGEYGQWTNIFPAVGIWEGEAGLGFGQMLRYNGNQLIIPILVLSSSTMAYITQQVRSSVSEELRKQYVWQLEAKGLKSRTILWKHVMRNASFPLITMLGGVLPAAIGGSLVMEVICNIPGMGRLMYDSIFGQDWNVVMLSVFVSAVLTVIGIALADITYAIVDPRTRPAL